MTTTSAHGELGLPAGAGHPGAQRVLMLAVVVGTLLAITGMLFLPGESEHSEAPPNARGLTTQLYPVTSIEQVATSFEQVATTFEGTFNLPAAVVPLGDEVVVLDTGQARLIKLDDQQQITAIFDLSEDSESSLSLPMAMATDGAKLYIANSLSAEVLVLDAYSGEVDRTITFEPMAPSDEQPRIIGLALLPDGGMAVSDADNHRVLLLDLTDRVVATAGAGKRESGSAGFNVPAAIAADADGNLYVVDTLNSRVVKLDPDGSYLMEFGGPGTTVGRLARPKGVAVSAEGNVFVSDAITASITVFSPDGAFIAIIGRSDPDDLNSPSLFRAPAAIWLDGDKLYVADRVAGVVILELGESPAEGDIANLEEPHEDESTEIPIP